MTDEIMLQIIDSGDEAPDERNRNDGLMRSRWFRVISVSIIFFFCYYSSFVQNHQTQPPFEDNVPDQKDSVLFSKTSEIVSSVSRRLSSPLGIISTHPEAPAIAWLMSFPASGSSYISFSIQAATRRAVASNYGNTFMHPNGEIIRDQYVSIPTYSDRINGPFLLSELPLPKNYIFTQTHCGGYCIDCFPGRYLMGPKLFKEGCHSGSRYDPEKARVNPEDNAFEMVVYDQRLVKRAVHLVRNPFDNIISRFHQEYKRANARGDDDFTMAYPYNSDGFHSWCDLLTKKFLSEEKEWYNEWFANMGTSVFEKSKDVPCHAEFYKYLQWHNHAFYVTDEAMHLPTLIVHYEDFQMNQEQTLHRITDFLEVDKIGDGMDFHYHTYDYFTQEEKNVSIEYMKMMASPMTWNAVSRYFDAYDGEAVF